jgi:CheY-like chemotaxis protein
MAAPHIVVVNDDPIFLALMAALLEGEGYRATAFPGGVGAYALIKREAPDLLILDLHMDRMDTGLTALQALRLDAATRHLPAIICSADGRYLAENAGRLLTQGCRVLHKPFPLEELLALVRATPGLAT